MDQMVNHDDLILSVDAFVRSIAVNRNMGAAFFLGAGASISSGVPSASTCIWQWKRDIFLTNNPGLSSQVNDVSLASTQMTVQRWLDSQGGYPGLGSSEEYGFYAEKCYPIVSDRRKFFQSLTEKAKPYIGYQLLCLLARAEILKSVWTTNFDGLVSRAAASLGVTVIEVGLDTAARMNRQTGRQELLSIALHGDYRYDALKNTSEEIQHQDATLRAGLETRLRDSTLIVIGYSGRDASIMEALRTTVTSNGSGRIYWCGFTESDVSQPIRDLLLSARECGREAYFVPTGGFDDVLIRLAGRCLTDELNEQAKQLLSATRSFNQLESPPFAINSSSISGIIKSNAFPITLPSEVMQFEVSGFDQPGAWHQLKETVADSNLVAGFQKGHVLALGTATEVKSVFSSNLASDVTLVPIIERELSYSDGVIVSLLGQALVRSIAGNCGLKSDGQRLLWMPDVMSEEVAYGERCYIHDAIKLYLRRYAGRNYVVIKPTVQVLGFNGQEVAPDVEREVKRRLLTKQYNNKFNEALEGWRKRLFGIGKGTAEFRYPPDNDSAFRFIIRPTPTFAKIGSYDGQSSIALPPAVLRLVANEGTEFAEPSLLLSNRYGDGFVADTHPLRGIAQNQPFDFGLTLNGLFNEIRLGVICPGADALALSQYLSRLHLKERPNSKLEYLVEYPGFAPVFGLPLSLPQPGDIGWVDCPEPLANSETTLGAQELRRLIISSINAVKASSSPHVVLVYIPERWRTWEHIEANGEYFDLHEFVKAYCVEQGIATQFLREATLAKRFQCEILWWLAVSIYAKSMRTPWALKDLDRDTAFMGLGLSLDSRAPRGQHVLLGCSHIYSSDGLGLNFKLGKIEHPIIRRDNPYMSRDDARRMGDSVRQLFYESWLSLPKRVVIHKRTPFDKEECEGLLEGLAGITSVDMVEISMDKALRYVASRMSSDGRFQGDGYPIKRGTTVILDSRRALLWAHGTTEPLDSRRRYYLGKSRIPTPLMLVRHHGMSSLSTLATEILGLSKMNWNTADMYDKLPATIQSSNKIAQIGALFQRFGGRPYDYRLFM